MSESNHIYLFPKNFETDYEQEQEMEIEALEAILMDDFKGLCDYLQMSS